MGCVDRSDQMVSGVKLDIKTFKWWKVFFHILSLTILNAYKSTTERAMEHRIFRRKLVAELIEQSVGSVPAPSAGWPKAQQLERLTGRHFPQKIAQIGRKAKSRMCMVCGPAERELLSAIDQKRKRPGHGSGYQCGQCNVTLCATPCFTMYHTNRSTYILEYKRWGKIWRNNFLS